MNESSKMLAVQSADELELSRKAAMFTGAFMHKTCLKTILSLIENDEVGGDLQRRIIILSF